MESEEAKLRRQTRQREYYRKNKEKILERSRRYRKEHPEKWVQYHKNANEKRSLGLGYYQRYYQRNKKKLTDYATRWREAHPDKMKEYQRRHREKMKALGLPLRKKAQKHQPDIDKMKALFRDPSKAAHLQWVIEHNKSKIKQYEPC